MVTGSVNWYGQCGSRCGGFWEPRNRSPVRLGYPLLGMSPEDCILPQRCLYLHVCCSSHNSKDIKSAWKPIGSGRCIDGLATQWCFINLFLYVILFMCNEKWNLQGNSVDLEVITLCEVTQTQKDRFHTVLAEADPSFWCFCMYMCGWECGKECMKQEGDHKKGKRSFEGRSLGRKRREDYWGRKVQLRGWPEDWGRGRLHKNGLRMKMP